MPRDDQAYPEQPHQHQTFGPGVSAPPEQHAADGARVLTPVADGQPEHRHAGDSGPRVGQGYHHHGEGEGEQQDVQTFWDGLYAERSQVWSGKVNFCLAQRAPALLSEVQSAGRSGPPRALDLGCGEGGDAMWLAQQGWLVTAVDVSGVAIARARTAAERSGLAHRIDFEQRDLEDGLPAGSFDLVSAQFFQSPLGDLVGPLRQAAGLIANGGTLLIVSHAAPPPWAGDHHPENAFPTPQQLVDALALDRARWHVREATIVERPAIGPDGQQSLLSDAVVQLQRSAPAA